MKTTSPSVYRPDNASDWVEAEKWPTLYGKAPVNCFIIEHRLAMDWRDVMAIPQEQLCPRPMAHELRPANPRLTSLQEYINQHQTHRQTCLYDHHAALGDDFGRRRVTTVPGQTMWSFYQATAGRLASLGADGQFVFSHRLGLMFGISVR